MVFALYYTYKKQKDDSVNKIVFNAPNCYCPSQALNWWKANCVVPKCWDYLSVWRLS